MAANALLPHNDERQRDGHGFAFVIGFDLLCVRCDKIVLRACLQGLPLQVLCKPTQCLDCCAARCAVHCSVLTFAGQCSVQKVHQEGHGDAP